MAAIHGLVILGSSITALAVLRDASALGLQVILADHADGIATRSRHGSKKRIDQSESGLNDLVRRSELGPGWAVIATSDDWLGVLTGCRPGFSLKGLQVLHHDASTLATCLDKRAFASFCRENGLPLPLTWFVDEEPRPSGLTFPMILRPARTHHGEEGAMALPKAIEVHDESELATWRSRASASGRSIVASQSLLGRRLLQFSVGYARRNSEVLCYEAVKRRPLPAQCEVGTYVELWPSASARRLALRVLDLLTGDGLGEIEILHDADSGEDFLIEVNPRPWLQYGLAIRSGYPLLGLLSGRAARTDGAPRSQPLAWVNLASDLINAFWRANGVARPTLWRYLQQLARVRTMAVFDLSDPWPGIVSASSLLLRQVTGGRAL